MDLSPVHFKVSFLTYNSEVVVETNDGLEHHVHDVDEEYENNPGAVFKWTDEITSIIEESEKSHNKPNFTLSLHLINHVCIESGPSDFFLSHKFCA